MTRRKRPAIEGKLVERNGALYVLYQTAKDSVPEMSLFWYRVERTTGNPFHANRPEAGDIAAFSSGGLTWPWNTRRADTHAPTGSVRTAEKAESVETVSVPAPKVRRGVEIRWYQGRWQKLLKRGWVEA